MGQVVPQAPQLVLLVIASVSHPSVSLLPSQSMKPASQAPLHTPEMQLGCEMWLKEQTTPQPPQLVGAVITLVSQPSTQVLLQFAKPGLQPQTRSQIPTTHWPMPFGP